MSRELIIIRHGKSSWNNDSLSDMERPLKNRGIEDAAVMGKVLMEKGIQPDVVLSSPALRAVSTARIIIKELGKTPDDIIINQGIYTASLDSLLKIIYGTDNETGSLMVFGHNPVFTDIVNFFSSEYIGNLPTCGTALLKFEAGSWREISDSVLISREILFPSQYR